MRLLSLSIRLFANILAGHLIILFMAGALAVILGVAALGWFTLPFGDPALRLRGRPRRRAAGVHLRDAHRHLPRRRGRRSPLIAKKECTVHIALIAARDRDRRNRQGRQVDRPRCRRRPRRRRRRRRHRHHLRQGDRGDHPPAGDARRDHPASVARLRADRGAASSTGSSPACSPRSSSAETSMPADPGRIQQRQLPDHPGRRADDLDAARVRDLDVAAAPSSRSRASATRSTGARRRSRTRSTRPSARARRRRSCSPSTASG